MSAHNNCAGQTLASFWVFLDVAKSEASSSGHVHQFHFADQRLALGQRTTLEDAHFCRPSSHPQLKHAKSCSTDLRSKKQIKTLDAAKAACNLWLSHTSHSSLVSCVTFSEFRLHRISIEILMHVGKLLEA